jgi:hypothetical protein
MDESDLEGICEGMAVRVAGEAAKGLGRQWRCPSDLREEIVRYALVCRETGEVLAPISERLGLIESTLARWPRQRREMEEVRRGFLSVAIVRSDAIQPSTYEPQLRLATVDGHIVEGLDVQSVAYLLKAIK